MKNRMTRDRIGILLVFLALCLYCLSIGQLKSTRLSKRLIVPFDYKEKGLPDAIIIGVRKGGTRALIEMLSLNPLIQIKGPEVHYFDRDENYEKGTKWYIDQMPATRPNEIAIEKSPRYFVDHRVPDRMRQLVPNAKLILLLRDPVDRLVSDWIQLQENRLKNHKQKLPLEALCLDQFGEVDQKAHIVRASQYSKHLAHWLTRFNRSQIHIVDSEELVNNPVMILNKAEKFLSIKSQITNDNFVYNETKGFYCLRYDNSSEPRCLNQSKGRAHPQLSPVLRDKLDRFFQNQSFEIAKLTGVEFDW